MVSRIRCDRWIERLRENTHFAFSLIDRTSVVGWRGEVNCQIDYENKRIVSKEYPSDRYGSLLLRSNGYLEGDAVAKVRFEEFGIGGGIGDWVPKNRVDERLEACGCHVGEKHGHGDALHIHFGCPPASVRCATKEVLKEP